MISATVTPIPAMKGANSFRFTDPPTGFVASHQRGNAPLTIRTTPSHEKVMPCQVLPAVTVPKDLPQASIESYGRITYTS